MKQIIPTLLLISFLLASCAPVDLNAPVPDAETGIDAEAWAKIPAGEFFFGQYDEVASTDAYEIMVTNVTAAQYAGFLNDALAEEYFKLDGSTITGYYPGDEFHVHEHEERIEAGDWLLLPLDDPSQRIDFDGAVFTVQPGYENHPM
ncbi:MAG: hypothetical protein EHM41_15720, partial [Chloroflexi bacterium]